MEFPWRVHAEIRAKVKSGEWTNADARAAYARYERTVRGVADWEPYRVPNRSTENDEDDG